MEYTFTEFGVPYLHWTNEKGESFEAVKEQVEIFGKGFFESTPEELTDGEYEMHPKEDYDYIDSWYEEHPNESAVPFPDWI